MRDTKRFAILALILLLSGVVFHQYTTRFKKEAIDFYTLWGVPTAQKLSGHTLGSPYRAIPQYGAFLREYLASVPDDFRLLRATDFWYGHPESREFRMNNSPLLYTTLGVFPERYSTAADVFRWVEVGLLVVAILLLAYLFDLSPPYAIVVGMVLLLILFPVHRDLSFGNVNALLVFALAVLLTLHRFQRDNLALGHGVLVGLLSSGIVLLILFKPLVLIPCLLLAVLFSCEASRQDRVIAAAVGLVAFVAGVAGPTWFFRSWTVWPDWLREVTSKGGLFYPSRAENCSLVTLIAEWAQIRPSFVIVAMGAFLVISILIALRPRRPFNAGHNHMEPLVSHARSACSDVGLVVSIGVIFTLALSPLVWIHYYVLAIIPALWLCTHPIRSQVGVLMAATFAVASSEPLVYVMREANTPHWYLFAQALSWVPLWIGILIAIGSTRSPHISVGKERLGCTSV